MITARILLLDDDDLIREVVRDRLESSGYEVVETKTMSEAREAMQRFSPDVALLDIKLPDGEGTELLPELGQGDVPAIMITAHATVESAVEALRLGAQDYLEKPFSMERLQATLRVALERNRLRRQIRALRRDASLGGKIVGSSPAMGEVMDLVERIAPAGSATVLIEGETGSGKGMVAKAVHEMSPRAGGPFVQVTCSALAESVMESELFGHERGAFTDARLQKRGLVEVAHEGTLFLDEIGELSVGVQGTLLRFIEEKAFRRVGGTRDLTVDARVIAATNRDLSSEVKQGRFRQDLYYRLRVLPLRLPPLRHRRSDIPALAASFIDRFNGEFGKSVEGLTPDAEALFDAYEWPGNVRELCNVVERGVLLTDSVQIDLDVLPPELGGRTLADSPGAVRLGPEGLDLEALEETLLREALSLAEGNRTEAGRLLGLTRHQVRNRIRKYGGRLS